MGGEVRVTDACSKSQSSTERGRTGGNKPNIHLTMIRERSNMPLVCYSTTSRDILSMNVPIWWGPLKVDHHHPDHVRFHTTVTRNVCNFQTTRRAVPSMRFGTQKRCNNVWLISVSSYGVVVDAVVDTAAEITMISRRAYKTLKPRQGGVKEINVRLTGEGTSMSARGKLNWNWRVSSSSICGLYCSRHWLFSSKPSLVLSGSEKFWFIRSTEAHKMLRPNPEVRVNAVSVRQLRVPPFSAQVIKCELDAKFSNFLLKPVSGFQGGLLSA